jgi:hypothetical protein
LATVVALAAVSLLFTMQRSSAQVGRSQALRSVAAAPVIVGQGGGSGSLVMDGDWFYVLRGNKFYKIQKSTFSVFQTLDLN